jgi:anti-sigma B factor antagonist
MKARVRRLGSAAVLKLSGKIAIGSGSDELTDSVLDLLEDGCLRIVLDLERVSYVDSSGLGTIVACRKSALDKGAEVVLLKPVGKVFDLLQLTGLWEILPVFSDEGEALAVVPPKR